MLVSVQWIKIKYKRRERILNCFHAKKTIINAGKYILIRFQLISRQFLYYHIEISFFEKKILPVLKELGNICN